MNVPMPRLINAVKDRIPRSGPRPKGICAGSAPERLVVLHEHNTPTLAYFERAMQACTPGVPMVLLDTAKTKASDAQLQPGDLVVVVRYLTQAWRQCLERHYPSLSGLAYFMDDDLLDAAAMRSSLPTAYVRRLYQKAGRHEAWLRRYCTEFWVSTPALAEKYASLQPKVVEPRPVNMAPASMVRVIYHGTMAHRAEIEWLRGIMAQVLAKMPNVSFQVFGDTSVNKLYADLPRVQVVHPMSWPNYLYFSSTQQADIGLAPLLPSPFNASRGPVKFFDYVRQGAVGVFSNVSPYSGFVRHEADGLLLPNRQDQWVRAVCELAAEPERRRGLVQAAQDRVLAMQERE